jgi:hypothetical protein
VEAVLAVIVGLAGGTLLAALVALPLRRKRRREMGVPTIPQARRMPLATAVQRQRAAKVAAGLAGASTFCMVAGAVPSAFMFMFGVALIGIQSAAGFAAERFAH